MTVRRKLVVFGATSKIVHETLRALPLNAFECILVARNSSELETIRLDLVARFPESKVSSRACDFSQVEEINLVWRDVSSSQPLDIVYVGFGSMEADEKLRTEQRVRDQFVATNINGVLNILMRTRQIFLQQGHGTLCVITSVAGDKGRRSNYIYGSAKALVSRVLEGMWHEFSGTPVQIIDVRPGITESPMTAHLKKGPLMTSASVVGGQIAKSILRGGPRIVYAPCLWYWIMLVVKHLPDAIFRRTKF